MRNVLICLVVALSASARGDDAVRHQVDEAQQVIDETKEKVRRADEMLDREAEKAIHKSKQAARETAEAVGRASREAKQTVTRAGRAARDLTTESAAGAKRGYHKAKRDLAPKEREDVE